MLIRAGTVFIVIFGILLPFIALFFELAWHPCRSGFFDPIPSIFHIAAVAFVPLGIWHVLNRTRREGFSPELSDFVVIGVVLTISGVYTIAFLPVMMLGIALLLAIPITFLPTSPFFSFLSGIILMHRLIQYRSTPRKAWMLHSLWSIGALLTVLFCAGGVLWYSGVDCYSQMMKTLFGERR